MNIFNRLLYNIAKPKTLISIVTRLKNPFLYIGLALAFSSCVLVFFLPPDYEQGHVFKFIYIHVPASWWALGIYTIMAVQAILGFVTRTPQCHIMAKNWALSGLLMTLISLITGMVWGKFTWGAYWVWDARLTTMFIQLLIYLSYVYLTQSDDREHNYSMGSILLVIGLVNLPLIKYSVEWWFTLHQPASLKVFSKNTIHSTYMPPLILNGIGFFLLSASLFCYNMKKNLLKISEA